MIHQHLLPFQVNELKALGVEFKDTIDIWIQLINNVWERKSRRSQHKKIKKYRKHQIKEEQWMIPCPDLQEVLEKLPKVIEVFKDECKEESTLYTLVISRINDDYWTVSYLCYIDPKNVLHVCNNEDLLLAAFEMLKIVKIKHPKNQ